MSRGFGNNKRPYFHVNARRIKYIREFVYGSKRGGPPVGYVELAELVIERDPMIRQYLNGSDTDPNGKINKAGAKHCLHLFEMKLETLMARADENGMQLCKQNPQDIPLPASELPVVKEKRPPRDAQLVFLRSFEWRNLRMKVLTMYGARCMCCGATPDSGEVMNVDHILPRKTHPGLKLDIGNLQVLCGTCNHGKGNTITQDFRNRDNFMALRTNYPVEFAALLARTIASKAAA